MSGKEKIQVVLDENSDAVFVRGCIKVQFNASGIDVYGDVPVTLHPAANDAAKAKPPLHFDFDDREYGFTSY